MRISGKIPYLIAFFATIIRYYDYALFGLSASIIADNFMPAGNKADKLLGFFMIFSLSVVARPVGSIIFGRISDRIGRATSIKITAITAAISVMLIALLPAYETIGFLATILVTGCRMLFLMSLAGEVDAIKIYIAERVGKNNRHLASSLVSFSAQIGALIAAGMYHFTLGFNQIFWLWRINFVIGGIFGILVFYLRNLLPENHWFAGNKARNQNFQNDNIFAIISANRLKFLLTTILGGGLGAAYNFLIIFLGAFASSVAGVISQAQASENNILLIIIYALSCIISGVLADRTQSVYRQITLSLLLSLILLILAQLLSLDGLFSFPLHLLIVFMVPMYAIPIQIKLQSLFPAAIRVRMYSLSHSVGSMIFSSTAPFFCMVIWKHTQSFFMVYIYFITIILLMILAVLLVQKKDYKNMFNT